MPLATLSAVESIDVSVTTETIAGGQINLAPFAARNAHTTTTKATQQVRDREARRSLGTRLSIRSAPACPRSPRHVSPWT
jgi:hypothetical protein